MTTKQKIKAKIKALFDAIGEDRLAEALEVTKHSVAYAKQNKIPSCWYLVVSDLAALEHVDCPTDIFSFKISGCCVPPA